MMKNKIRILHVAQAAGGVDRYIRMLLKYLDKEKFENSGGQCDVPDHCKQRFGRSRNGGSD